MASNQEIEPTAVTVRGIPVLMHITRCNSVRFAKIMNRIREEDISAVWDLAVLYFGEEQADNIVESLGDDSLGNLFIFIGECVHACGEEEASDPK